MKLSDYLHDSISSARLQVPWDIFAGKRIFAAGNVCAILSFYAASKVDKQGKVLYSDKRKDLRAVLRRLLAGITNYLGERIMLYAALTDSKIIAGDLIFPLIVGLVSGTVVAFISVYFVNRNLKKLSTYQKLSSYGFVEIGTVWQTESEVKKMCKNAETIKLINVSGLKYHRNYEKHIKKALKNGVEIYNLVTDPDSFFLTDIEEMEKKTIWNGQPVRKKETFIKTETKELIDMYKQTNLHIRFYRSEYRLPFIMAYYKDGSIHTWLRVTLPPLRSEQAMVLRGVKESNSMNETILDFIDMMELSFDSIWEHSAWSDKKVEEMRNQALEKAEPEEEAAAPLTDTP